MLEFINLNFTGGYYYYVPYSNFFYKAIRNDVQKGRLGNTHMRFVIGDKILYMGGEDQNLGLFNMFTVIDVNGNFLRLNDNGNNAHSYRYFIHGSPLFQKALRKY